MNDYFRHSRATIRDKRWPALRLECKRRDGWRCVQCGARGRLEVDHIEPVRAAPELAFVLANLQTLCASCHSKKTIIEAGLQKPITNRDSWIESIETLMSKGSTYADQPENRPPPVGDSPETGAPRWC